MHEGENPKKLEQQLMDEASDDDLEVVDDDSPRPKAWALFAQQAIGVER